MTLRLSGALLGTFLLGAACGGPTSTDGGQRSTGSARGEVTLDAAAVEVTQVRASPKEDGPSALVDPLLAGLPAPLVPLDEMIDGGPPPDGIPPIDRPRFLRAGDVDFLEDEEPVLALQVGDEDRAYPVQVLIWHEIVNDTVGGVPVAVTYCPLCNSAIAYERRVGDRVLSFGTSGKLYLSALIMYDRQTESLWAHFTGTAVAGRLAGTELVLHPVATVSWAQWRDAHPDGLVLSRNTGNDRPYGENPYPGYDNVRYSPFLFKGDPDGRLPAKTRMVGVAIDDESVAVLLDELAEQSVVELSLAGRDLVVWHTPGTASALFAYDVADGPDVGSTGVFDPHIDGQRLRFRPEGDGFVDEETSSRWDVLGRAVAGPLEGRSLDAVTHVDTFWFAWAAYRPDTAVVPGGDS